MKLLISFGLPIGPVAQHMIQEALQGEKVVIICVPQPTTGPLTSRAEAWVSRARAVAVDWRIDMVVLPELGALAALILPELARQEGRDDPDLPDVVVLKSSQFALELAEVIPGAMFRTW